MGLIDGIKSVNTHLLDRWSVSTIYELKRNKTTKISFDETLKYFTKIVSGMVSRNLEKNDVYLV